MTTMYAMIGIAPLWISRFGSPGINMYACMCVCVSLSASRKQHAAHEPLINIFYTVVGPGGQQTTTKGLQDCVNNHGLDDENNMLSGTASDIVPPVASASSSAGGGESTIEYDDSDDSFRDGKGAGEGEEKSGRTRSHLAAASVCLRL